VRRLRLAELDGWSIKVYGIAYGGEHPDPALVQAGLQAARGALPSPAVTDRRYGAGFLGAHEGRGSNFVFLDWWADENELHHRVWFSEHDTPGDLPPAGPEDPIACAWDLAVVAHERERWVEHVLARVGGPDVGAYLAAWLHADV